MAVTSTGILDTSVKLATSPPLTLTGETIISLYIFGETGAHKKHEVVIQVSPGGTTWMDHPMTVRGEGFITVTLSAAKVQACVINKEDSASTVTYHLVAR